MKKIKPFLLFSFLVLFVSCNGDDFEPNSLITVDEDKQAEIDLAKQSGAPYFDTIAVTADQVFGVGSIISISAKFQKRTKIISGPGPRIPLNIGGVTRYADYVSGSDSMDFTFLFQYTVQAGDLDHDGIELVSPWELNGSVVQDYNVQDAILTFTPPNLSGRLVDTSSLSIAFADGVYTNNASPVLNITSLTGSEMYLSSTCLSGGSAIGFSAATNYTLPILNASNTVYVAVGNGSGGFSQCQSATIIHDNQAPNDITGILLSGDASDIKSDTTSWSATTDNGPSGLNRYEIAISTTTSAANIIASGGWITVGTNTTGKVDNGAAPYLAPVTDYYTLIRAIDNAGNISNVAASASWQVAALSPEQITSMAVITATQDSLKVGWPYPDDNGFPIVNYQVEMKLSSSSTWGNQVTKTVRNHTYTGLTAETNYDFRVRSYNGTNYGPWSPTLNAETLPNISFVSTPYRAINVGGATLNQLVSLEDGNEIYYGNNTASTYNDGSLISASLDRGKTVAVPANDFTVVVATKPFFIAGRLGSGSDTRKANVVWHTSSWIGKDFLFSFNRSAPLIVKVYAFTNSTVTITRNGAPITGGTKVISEETGDIFSIPTTGSYEMTSTGFIAVYVYASGSSSYVDPMPLLPISNDLLGVPSRDAKIASSTTGNTAVAYHSDGVNDNKTFNAGTPGNVDQNGTSGLYQDAAVRIRSTDPISANSYADANGSCSAPLVPVAFQKTKFAINVQAEWVAMASTDEVTVTAYEPNAAGDGWEVPRVYNLTRTGTNNNTPTKGYETGVNFRAGTIFEGTGPFQMYYEPSTDTNGSDNDETIMFGWD